MLHYDRVIRAVTDRLRPGVESQLELIKAIHYTQLELDTLLCLDTLKILCIQFYPI